MILEELQKKLKKTLNEEFGNELTSSYEFKITIPNYKKFGDFSTSAAMDLAKTLKISPLEIAEKLVNNLGEIKYVENVEIKKPGFINFFLNYKTLTKDLSDKYINSVPKVKKKTKKVIIEHTSVNPNKSLHIGHLRNAILGDTFARLMQRLNYSVEVQNYIDDTGSQVADTTLGLLYMDKYKKIPKNKHFDDFCSEVYADVHKSYEEDEKLLKKRQEVIKQVEERNNEVSKKADEIVEKIVQNHIELLKNFNISYNLLVYESDVLTSGLWDSAFEILRKSKNFKLVLEGKNKGCWVLKNKGEGGDKVFVRSNGTKVYTAKDTAYHMWKFGLLKRDFKYDDWFDIWRTKEDGRKIKIFGNGDLVLNIIDERQKYPQRMVRLALDTVGFKEEAENLKHIDYGVVELSKDTAKDLGIDVTEGKKSYAMSGREGIDVKVRDLLDATIQKIKDGSMNSDELDEEDIYNLAISSIRYYILKYRSNSKIIFDFNESLSLNGNTAPYIQYSCARAKKLLKKVGESLGDFRLEDIEFSDSEKDLILNIYKWDLVLEQAYNNLSIGYITDFAYELSSSFHSFYQNNQVIVDNKALKSFRIFLVVVYLQIIRDVFETLGIKEVKKM